jgi:hypothetical protein
MAPPRCQYCGKAFKTPRAVNHHISASKARSTEWRNDLYKKEDHTATPSPKRLKKESLTEDDVHEFEPDILGDFVMNSQSRRASEEVEEVHNNEGGKNYTASEIPRFIESYPGDAGEGIRKSKTQYEEWLESQREDGKNRWDPFASEQEWALARWLILNVGQKATDEFLKLSIVSKIYAAFYI